MIEPRQLVLRESPFCGPCPANRLCSEKWTDLGCFPDFVAPLGNCSHILHPSLPDFLSRIAECNGLDFNIVARVQAVPALPPYLPLIRPWKRIDDFHAIPAVALPLSQVKPLAARVEATGCSAKALLGLADHQLLLVMGFEHDRFLEAAWPRARRRELLTAIRALQPDAAIAWGYSVWHRDAAGRRYPRVEHLYNLKRSLVVYAELQDRDIPAIPHVYWGLREDLDRWSEWLALNRCVSIIAMDLQTLDATADWKTIMRDLEYFRSILPRDTHCLFSGVCKLDRIQQLIEVWPEASLCNYGPYFAAAFAKKTAFAIRPRPGCESNPHARIFRCTVDRYAGLMSRHSSVDGASHLDDDWGRLGKTTNMLGPMGTPTQASGGWAGQLPLFSRDLWSDGSPQGGG